MHILKRMIREGKSGKEIALEKDIIVRLLDGVDWLFHIQTNHLSIGEGSCHLVGPSACSCCDIENMSDLFLNGSGGMSPQYRIEKIMLEVESLLFWQIFGEHIGDALQIAALFLMWLLSNKCGLSICSFSIILLSQAQM